MKNHAKPNRTIRRSRLVRRITVSPSTRMRNTLRNAGVAPVWGWQRLHQPRGMLNAQVDATSAFFRIVLSAAKTYAAASGISGLAGNFVRENPITCKYPNVKIRYPNRIARCGATDRTACKKFE